MRAYLFSALALASTQALATVITVSNNAAVPAQYTSLQLAIDDATAGDTIYVAGSPTNYGNITMDKQLALLGQGHAPNGSGGISSQLNVLYLQAGVNGSVFYGLRVGTIGFQDNGYLYSDILISRCKINASINGNDPPGNMQNILVFNSIIGYSRINDCQGCVFSNSVFIGSTEGLSSGTNATILVKNCVFIGPLPGGGATHNCVFENNIFLGLVTDNSVQNCSFANNLSYDCTPYCSFSGGVGNTSSNNLVDTAVIFEGFNPSSESFSLSNDLRLAPGSPGVGFGTDGTDIGVFGGSSPFVPGTNYFGSPKLPKVQQMSVLNEIVGEGGELEINAVGVAGQ